MCLCRDWTFVVYQDKGAVPSIRGSQRKQEVMSTLVTIHSAQSLYDLKSKRIIFLRLMPHHFVEFHLFWNFLFWFCLNSWSEILYTHRGRYVFLEHFGSWLLISVANKVSSDCVSGKLTRWRLSGCFHLLPLIGSCDSGRDQLLHKGGCDAGCVDSQGS